jgi:effector-binding domain-containing protein
MREDAYARAGFPMVVDFRLKKAPRYRVATIAWKGPWSERRIRSQFDRIAKWAATSRVRTGKWIFREPGTRSWEVGIEIRGPTRGKPPFRMKTYPSSAVVCILFDPTQVSPSVAYHAVNDWLKWRKRDKTIRAIGMYREVYEGDPWRNARVWSRTEIQVAVRR